MQSRGKSLELFLLNPLRYIAYKLKLIRGLLGAFVFFPRLRYTSPSSEMRNILLSQ
jgi:hypothetical protein